MRVEEVTIYTEDEAAEKAEEIGFPLVMKVVGPVHKSDLGGVILNIDNRERAVYEFRCLMDIPEAEAVLMQPMVCGQELFAGAVKETGFGHLIMAGLGGIFIEVLKDVNSALVPLGKNEANNMIRKLKGFKILEGTRGQKGVNIEAFADTLTRLSLLLEEAPEIAEMDLNPLMGTPETVKAVDARIRIEQ
jgi:acetyltransferase